MHKPNLKPHCDGARCRHIQKFNITMAFQPLVDVEARAIYAYEALVRGTNGEGAYEVLSKVTEDDVYAFDQACRVRAIELACELGLDVGLNINFMPNAVYHPLACLRKTMETARMLGFPTEKITFEFTENERVVDRDHLKAIIEAYHDKGFLTAIDDFGSGYAGLSLLSDLQTDVLKIDSSIVRNVEADHARQVIIEGIVSMAKQLGMQVLAEGVETKAEYIALCQLRVRYMQGYLFARPQIAALPRIEDIKWPNL